MVIKLEFIWYNPKLSPNKRGHYMQTYKLRKKQRSDTHYQLLGTPIPSKREKYILDIIFNPPGDYGYDADNSLSAIKGLLDELAKYWGVNDNQFIPRPVIGSVVKGGKIVIELV